MATENKINCEICNVSTSDQISYDNHLLGAKHQLAMHKKRNREKRETCSIFVTGFAPSTKKEALHKFFSQYDKITDMYPENFKGFGIIQFENEKTVDKLLKLNIYFQGRKLLINRKKKKPEPDEVLTANLKIVQNIDSNLDFDKQLDQFLGAVQLPFQKTMDIYIQLCADIKRCLIARFVNCRVWPFGSTVSGLSFKQSDIDVFIEVLCHPTITNATESSLAAEYVKIARNRLAKSNLFTFVIGITKAKTPIVKCKHKPTGVNCDMNFKNMLGVCNSRLINFMLSLDTRLRPTMIIIKFWAQMQELSGSGRFSNYGLTMMFLFYLQQPPDPIVPPIEWLQTEHTRQFHEGWNGGFCDDLKFLPNIKTSNKLSIPELLHGFFQFYAKYEYGFNVICPLLGKSIPKTDFMTMESLPEKLFHYKNMVENKCCKPLKYTMPLCVQDPFELSHNITAIVPQKLLEHFQSSCQITSTICSECLTKNHNNLLKSIFKVQKILNFTVTDDECVFQMQVNDTLNYIDHSCIKENVDDKSKVLRAAWFEKINQFLISALSKIFLFDVTIKKDIQKHKFQKVDEQSDVHDGNVIDSITFHCVGYHNVWDARKSSAKTLCQAQNGSTNFFDSEIAISDYIANDLCKGIKLPEPIVDFHFVFNSKINPTEAQFILRNTENSRKNCFRQMATFFATKLTVWFEKWMKETSDKEKGVTEPNPKNTETKTNNITTSDVNIEDVKIIDDNV